MGATDAPAAALPAGGRASGRGAPRSAQARLEEVAGAVRGLIRDLAAARADLADRESAGARRDERLFLDLIDVLDAADRVLADAAARNLNADDGARALLGNVRTVVRMLEGALRAQGVVAMPQAAGEFDPARHVAVEVVADPALEPGTIAREVSRGYLVADRVLRKPGVVVVEAGTKG